MSEFISKVTTEQKKIRDLKYTLYTYGVYDADKNKCAWSCVIVDRYDQKTNISCAEETMTDYKRAELTSIIEGIKWIYLTVTKSYRKYIKITLCSSNIFPVNILREYLDLWKDDIDTRPNSDLLKELILLKSKICLDIKWVSKSHNEHSWNVIKITNDKINTN